MQPAIQVDKLCKRYYLGVARDAYRTLRDTIMEAVPWRRRNGSSASKREFWALRDVSFEVQPGEIVGIIGRNGAGKSTLLKILSRIVEPTSGRAEMRGRLGSLLEVGTGFHQELTGSENIYLNGAILGMSRAEIKRKFDDIVAFSEIEQFLDTPVKRYSSGMYVRLAFAVAAHLEPELLIVDEVLAVGDVSFQRKCLGKMSEVAQLGRTILFVTHNMGAITHLCKRAIWLEKGHVRTVGEVNSVVAEYLGSCMSDCGEVTFDESSAHCPASEYVALRAVRLRDHLGRVVSTFDVRQPFNVEMEYDILRPALNLRIGLRLVAQEGTVVLSTTDRDCDDEAHIRKPGRHVSRCSIPGNFLNYGQYYVSVGADFPMSRVHFALDSVLAFRVDATGGVGGHIADGRLGLLRLQLPWVIEQTADMPELVDCEST